MDKFSFAVSHESHWRSAAKELETKLSNRNQFDAIRRLGWFYVTDDHSDNLNKMVLYLRQATGVSDWVGSVGMGICWHDGSDDFGETFGSPGAIVMISEHREDSFAIFQPLEELSSEISEPARSWMDRKTPPFAVVHGDPMNGVMPGLVETLALKMENVPLEAPGFLVGGLTSSRDLHCQIAGDIVNGGLSGVMFAPEVEVATGLTQGYVPIGSSHHVTDCMENVVTTLNNKPALSVLKSDVGELLARDIARVAGYIHAAFPIAGSDRGEYLVRNLVGIDLERGWLAVGGAIETGDKLIFVRRDPPGAEEDLVRMVSELVDRLPRPARGGIYFSCVARGSNLFGKQGREMEIITEITQTIPLVGFFGQGEISNNRLYGYTGVLVLFL